MASLRPALSIIWLKHPTSGARGYITWRIDKARLCVDALSLIVATSRPDAIPYWAWRTKSNSLAILSPVRLLAKSYIWTRRCWRAHSVSASLTMMAIASPSLVVPSKITLTFLPSISDLIFSTSSWWMKGINLTWFAAQQGDNLHFPDVDRTHLPLIKRPLLSGMC